MAARTVRRIRVVIDRRDVAEYMVRQGGVAHRAIDDATDWTPFPQRVANFRCARRLADDLDEPSMFQRKTVNAGELLPPAFLKGRLEEKYDFHGKE